jgi:hypothetical protein
MRRFFVSIAAVVAFAEAASAGPLVVWLEPEVPDTRAVRKAESDAGEATHLSHVDLAFPPNVADAADDAGYDALRAVIIDGGARWDEWDIELELAQDLYEALDNVTVVRNDRDLRDVVDAYLLAGAAVDEAGPFRVEAPGGPINRGWYTAMGLAAGRTFARADIADGAPFDDFAVVQRRAAEFPVGSIDLERVPDTAQVYVDGTFVGTGIPRVELAPGEHYFHIVRGGLVAGRQRVRVESGRTVATPMAVDDGELAAARSAFLEGSMGAFPEDVSASLDAIQRTLRQGVFLAAVDDEGHVEIRPYRGAELVGKRLVTFLGTGEIGFGFLSSPLFDGANGETVGAPGVQGGLGIELGISHFALMGGMEAAFTPTETVTYGNRDQTENSSTAVLPQPWGGVGVYILRPNKPRPTLLLAGTYSYLSPGHAGLGGRVVLGLPIDDDGTWFRVTAGGAHAGNVTEAWDAVFADSIPMDLLFLRLGFATRF